MSTETPSPPDSRSRPLTVIMPAYNEEGAITEAVADVERCVMAHVHGAQLLVINDGSKDRTGAVLDEMSARNPDLRVIHQPNGGHGAALLTGLRAADADCVMLIDSDRQIPLDQFPAFWAAMEGGRDAAFGVRRTRHDPAIRLALTRAVRVAITIMFGVRLHDANVPFKVLRRSVWQAAQPLIPPGTLAPSLFLAIFAKRHGFDIVEIDTPHQERTTGEVSIKRWKLFRFCATALGQMIQFRKALVRAG